jgi:hypothetical protein
VGSVASVVTADKATDPPAPATPLGEGDAGLGGLGVAFVDEAEPHQGEIGLVGGDRA